ncbi:ATP-dependent RNA helicase SUV3L mitochondrial, partial [Bienertia sinuspersici]
MYMWLSNHFKKESFPYRQKAKDMASNIAELLEESLTKANWKPESRKDRKSMMSPRHRISLIKLV